MVMKEYPGFQTYLCPIWSPTQGRVAAKSIYLDPKAQVPGQPYLISLPLQSPPHPLPIQALHLSLLPALIVLVLILPRPEPWVLPEAHNADLLPRPDRQLAPTVAMQRQDLSSDIVLPVVNSSEDSLMGPARVEAIEVPSPHKRAAVVFDPLKHAVSVAEDEACAVRCDGE